MRRVYKNLLAMLFMLLLTSSAYAWQWRDLWLTPDQQAQQFMNAGQFDKASALFETPAWQAAAAFRTKEYAKAQSLYQSLQGKDAYYNQGNALAHLGRYQAAINAYDKALAIHPDDEDARFNRTLVASLLKKQNQDQNNQNKQDQNEQNQDQHKQNKQDQDQQSQNQHNQDKQDQGRQNQDQQNQDKQDQDKQNQDQQNQDKQDQDKQNQDQPHQDKQAQDKQNQDQQNQHEQDKTQAINKEQEDKEQREAKEQWLRLIPDDPGGLMREKFRRDYLHRQQGWKQ